jgi:hypothetical protein
MRYRVEEPTTVDLDAGRVTASFDAGVCTPSNEVETEALEHLVSIGLAEVVRGRPTETEE